MRPGLAAVLVGFANYIDPAAAGQFKGAEKTIHEVEIYIGILIGAVTFSGSLIAFGKLSGKISGKPVLLRIDYRAGHGLGSTRRQRQEELADIWSFFLWQCGDPDFQPAGPVLFCRDPRDHHFGHQRRDHPLHD